MKTSKDEKEIREIERLLKWLVCSSVGMKGEKERAPRRRAIRVSYRFL